MFAIGENNTLLMNRGDTAIFSFSAEKDGVQYTFKQGELLRLKVYGRKNADKVFLRKDFPVLTDSAEIKLELTGDDTKLGPVISKPTEYWYEIELNPDTIPQTVLGYDEDGPKVFMLYPEGSDSFGNE